MAIALEKVDNCEKDEQDDICYEPDNGFLAFKDTEHVVSADDEGGTSSNRKNRVGERCCSYLWLDVVNLIDKCKVCCGIWETFFIESIVQDKIAGYMEI